MKLKSIATAGALLACVFSGVASPLLEVQNAWVRATVAGQSATGAFMTLTARHGATLVSVSAPVAGLTQVHEMKMEGDIMRMRAVQGGLALPPGQAVQLKPGGLHLMLLDLKAAIVKGSTVPITLVLKDAAGVQSELVLQVPAATSLPGGGDSSGNQTKSHTMTMPVAAPKTQ